MTRRSPQTGKVQRKSGLAGLEPVGQRTVPDRTPRSPLVAPPRGPMQSGDAIAIHGGWREGFDAWIAGRFENIDHRGYTAFSGVLPWQPTQTFARLSYGDPTGLQADLATTFWRYAEEIIFTRLCPHCLGAGGLDAGYCVVCENQHRIVCDPFRETWELVHHYKATSQGRPTILQKYPSGVPWPLATGAYDTGHTSFLAVRSD